MHACMYTCVSVFICMTTKGEKECFSSSIRLTHDVHAHMHACIFIRLYMYPYTCILIYIAVRKHSCMHTYKHLYKLAYTCTHISYIHTYSLAWGVTALPHKTVQVCIHVCIHVYMYIYMCVYIYIYIYIYIHTHTHTYTYVSMYLCMVGASAYQRTRAVC
jgi:hypothetical protein